MRCYCKILCISYEDHVTNEEACAEIQQAIGPHENLLTTVKRHKLQCYGHVSRSSGQAKTILQGTVKGGRRQGRQRKRWEDNIKEWTGLEFTKSQRAVENREKWRKLVAKSSVVPQWPSLLRDWWWWWWVCCWLRCVPNCEPAIGCDLMSWVLNWYSNILMCDSPCGNLSSWWDIKIQELTKCNFH